MAISRKATRETYEAVAALSSRLSLSRICATYRGLEPGDKATLSRILNSVPISPAAERKVRRAIGLEVKPNMWPYRDEEQRQRVRGSAWTLAQIIDAGLRSLEGC